MRDSGFPLPSLIKIILENKNKRKKLDYSFSKGFLIFLSSLSSTITRELDTTRK